MSFTCKPDFSKYDGQKDNYGKPRTEYVARLQAMDNDKLIEETERKIWLSAYASNNSRSDYHWHVDACYDVLMDQTGSDAAYAACYERVKESL